MRSGILHHRWLSNHHFQTQAKKCGQKQYITHCIPGVGIHKEWCGNIQGMEQNETGLLQDSWEQKEWTRNPPGVQEWTRSPQGMVGECKVLESSRSSITLTMNLHHRVTKPFKEANGRARLWIHQGWWEEKAGHGSPHYMMQASDGVNVNSPILSLKIFVIKISTICMHKYKLQEWGKMMQWKEVCFTLSGRQGRMKWYDVKGGMMTSFNSLRHETLSFKG